MQRKKPLRRKTWLRSVSPRQALRNKAWRALKAMLLGLWPVCQATLRSGDKCYSKSVDIHHKHGRLGKWLLFAPMLMAVCRYCHDNIHDHPAWARKIGYLVD